MLDRLSRRWQGLKAFRLFGRKVEVFGNFTVIGSKNVVIGERCAINDGVMLNARDGIEIGDDVVLSARVMILAAGLDPASFGSAKQRRYRKGPVRIGAGAWIGAGAIILPGVTVGELAIVGAGAVVTRDVPPSAVVAGNPARVLGNHNPAGA